MTAYEELSAPSYALPPEVAAKVISPALLIDLARVRRNVAHVIEAIGDADRWRPHVKTTKIPEVWQELSKAGVRGYKCATVREARHLAQLLESEAPGEGDICLAFPAQGPALQQLGQLALRHPGVTFSIVSEHPEHVDRVPDSVGVFVDVDPGFERTGLAPSKVDAILAVAAAAGPRFRGVHAYEGHLTQLDYDERRSAAFAGYETLLALLEALRSQGTPAAELVTSGTPGFRCALEFEPFARLEGTRHRVSPGTLVVHDNRGWEQNPELDLEPAAVVFTRVVSHPGAGRATCDAGSKTLAAEAGSPCALVIGHPELVAGPPSEEHLPLEVLSGSPPPLGTELYLAPRHACPTINLAEEALLLDGGRVLGPVPVAPRAHDLWAPAGSEVGA